MSPLSAITIVTHNVLLLTDSPSLKPKFKSIQGTLQKARNPKGERSLHSTAGMSRTRASKYGTFPSLQCYINDVSQFPSHPSDSSQPALDLLSSSPGRSHNAQTRISHSPGHQSRVTIISDSTNASDSQELADVAPAPKVDLRPGHSQNANDEICLQRDRDHVPEISGIQVNDSRPWPPVDPNSEAYTRSAQKQPHSSIQPLKRLRSLASYSGDAEINHKVRSFTTFPLKGF